MVVGDGSGNALAHRHDLDVRFGSGRMLAERVISARMADVLWCKSSLAGYATGLYMTEDNGEEWRGVAVGWIPHTENKANTLGFGVGE